jgi:hypothetical protein
MLRTVVAPGSPEGCAARAIEGEAGGLEAAGDWIGAGVAACGERDAAGAPERATSPAAASIASGGATCDIASEREIDGVPLEVRATEGAANCMGAAEMDAGALPRCDVAATAARCAAARAWASATCASRTDGPDMEPVGAAAAASWAALVRERATVSERVATGNRKRRWRKGRTA